MDRDFKRSDDGGKSIAGKMLIPIETPMGSLGSCLYLLLLDGLLLFWLSRATGEDNGLCVK